MSPSSQSRVFYFEEQFPRGCFSFSQQVQYQTECVCSGERGGGGSLLLNKRLFTILSFELNIEISLKTCTPMTYECGELMTSKWGPKLLSTPRGGLLTGDCEKPANTRTTLGQSSAHRLSSCGMWAWQLWFPGSRGQAQQFCCLGLAVPQQVGSSQIRDRTYISYIGRQIFYH